MDTKHSVIKGQHFITNNLSTIFLTLLVDGANSSKEIFKRVCHIINLLVESSDNLILLLNEIYDKLLQI